MQAASKQATGKKAQIEGRAQEIISGSEIVLRSLLAEESDIIFGYPGGAIMPIYDALYDYQDRIQHILVRHEQGAIHAAQGFARASGKVGVVFATSGPGATNLVTGLADALIDSTPLVCITGQVYAHLLGTDAFQETDVINITAPVTKWNFQVTRAEELAPTLAKAFYIAASGRPGPVLVDVTKNAQLEKISFEGYSSCKHIRSYQPIPKLNYSQIAEAAGLIQSAEKPLVVFGQGVILGRAETEFRAFIEHAQLPAAWTILGLSALPTEHPLNMGMLGMHGNYGPNVLTNECDVLIAIGMRFDDRVTGKLDAYAKQAKVIHIDIDASEIDKNVKSHIGICGDCREVLPELTKRLKPQNRNSWIDRFDSFRLEERKVVIEPEFHPSEGMLSMAEVIDALNQKVKGEGIVVTDVGQHQMVTCRYAAFNKTRSNITSGGLGTMGFALPAAIGAQKGAHDRQVIAVIGDGGFQMTIQELGTIMQYKIPVKILILNNQFLGMVRQWQELFHEKRYSFVEMDNPDFVAIAAGYRIPGKTITERENLQEAIREMMETPGPYLLEAIVRKEGNVFPMIPQGCSVSEVRLC
jgi:acetolactate synthase-1/2/3 large subunit